MFSRGLGGALPSVTKVAGVEAQKRKVAILIAKLLTAKQASHVASMALASMAAITSLASGGEIRQATTAVTAINRSQLPEHIKSALRQRVEESPDGDRRGPEYGWVCEIDGWVAAAVAIEKTARPKLATFSASQAACFSEMIFLGIRKNQFDSIGFSDNELLRDAILKGNGFLQYRGLVKGVLFQSYAIEDWAVTVSYCRLDNISAALLAPEVIAELGESYSQAGHRRLRQAIATKDWPLAEKTWTELARKNLLFPAIVIDYGKCLVRQGKVRQSVAYFANYMQNYRELKDADFFLNVADVLEPLAAQSKDAETVALKAIHEAEKRMLGKQNKILLPSSLSP